MTRGRFFVSVSNDNATCAHLGDFIITKNAMLSREGKLFSYWLLNIMALSLLLWGCQQAAKDAKSQASADEIFKTAPLEQWDIDTAQSVLFWGVNLLRLPIRHSGELRFGPSKVLLADSTITGGDFLIRGSSIKVTQTDLPLTDVQKVTAEIKSKYLLDTDNYPTLRLVLTDVSPTFPPKDSKLGKVEQDSIIANQTHTFKAKLTVKDSTHELGFPGVVTHLPHGKLKARIKLSLERRLWNLKYTRGAGSDETIAPTIDFDIHIYASKQKQSK